MSNTAKGRGNLGYYSRHDFVMLVVFGGDRVYVMATQYWLMKSEPETWSWQDQIARGAKGEMWDGVRNYQAANFMREMQKSDLVLFYHSGKSREIVGIAEVIKTSFPDPTDDTGKFVAITVKAKKTLPSPVSLSAIKGDSRFAEMLLIKQSRLSVMPVKKNHWDSLMKLAGL